MRASYQNAIDWIAHNDDTSDLFDEEMPPLITAHLVADIFGKDIDTVQRDLRKAVRKAYPNAVR